MMRIKIQMLAMMFIAALALGACSDDDDKDDVKVPEAMSQALKSKYPSAIHVECMGHRTKRILRVGRKRRQTY